MAPGSLLSDNINAGGLISLELLVSAEKELHLDVSSVILRNISAVNLKNAAEMFLYLFSCPKASTMWIIFFNDLIQHNSPYSIVLTLNRIMKGVKSMENEHGNILAKKLFEKITKSFSLKYKEIQNMFPGVMRSRLSNLNNSIPKLSPKGVNMNC